MRALDNLIGDVEGCIARASGSQRDQTLSRITDLLVHDAPKLGYTQIGLFDDVLGRFAPQITVAARALLAERLADLRNAPPKTIRLLALDAEIAVARPVLTRSPRLADQDLMEVAQCRGREHQAAISCRRHVSEMVTDLLVADGDGSVRRAVAANPGARLSPMTTATLVSESREDDELAECLGTRPDLKPEDADRLVSILKENARARILAALPPGDETERAATDRQRQNTFAAYEAASAAVSALLNGREITEADLASLTATNRLPEAVCAVSLLTNLPVRTVDRVFQQSDSDLLLILAKAHNWSWRTVRLLLNVRDPGLAERNQLRAAESTFEGLATTTARRVVQVLASRETGKGKDPFKPAER